MRLSHILFPQDKRFYDLLNKASANLIEVAKVLKEAVSDLERCAYYAQEANRLEHEGDRITRSVMELLNLSLITPIDREDIHNLIQAIDDVVDITEGVLERMALYKVASPLPQVALLANELVEACIAINEAVKLLNKPRLYEKELTPHLERVIQAEKRGDHAYRKAIAELFNGSKEDLLTVIKWREVLEFLEEAVDACEKVSDVIQTIMLKSG